MAYRKAALLGFLASSILFMALPLPDTLSIRGQVLILLAVQASGVASAMVLAHLLGRRRRVEFDLLTGRPRRARLRLVRTGD